MSSDRSRTRIYPPVEAGCKELKVGVFLHILKNCGFPEKIEESGIVGLEHIFQSYLEHCGIELVYPQEDARRIKSLIPESGLIISNHPAAWLDFPVLLTIIGATKLKCLLEKWIYDGLVNKVSPQVKDVLSEHLVPIVRSSKELHKTLSGFADHVKTGGLGLIYPTGGKGREPTSGSVQAFGSGFIKLVEELPPKTPLGIFNLNFPPNYLFNNPTLFALTQLVRASRVYGPMITVEVRAAASTTGNWSQDLARYKKVPEKREVASDLYRQVFYGNE